MVTDAPEWAVRTTQVPCSVEARVAGYAVELADSGNHAAIDWDKEIGLPADPAAELASRFEEMYDAAARLEDRLRPTVAEAEAVDADDRRHQEGHRFASAMAEVLLIVESAAKVTYVISLGAAPPKKHNIVELLADQPETVQQAFHTLAGSALDLASLHEWRKSNYVADRPQLPAENQLREQCGAALSIGAIVADACRRQDISERDLDLWDHHCERVSTVLDEPIRLPDRPGRSSVR